MTEAERIEIRKEAIKYAKEHSSAPDKETPDWIINDYIAGATAENERLQQQLKEKDEAIKLFVPQMEYANNTIKKFSEAYNEKERELKSAQELNQELVQFLEQYKFLFDEGGQTRQEIESLINKAK